METCLMFWSNGLIQQTIYKVWGSENGLNFNKVYIQKKWHSENSKIKSHEDEHIHGDTKSLSSVLEDEDS